MRSNRTRKTFKRNALCFALGVCLASGAYAQSNTSGAVFGQAAAGDVIIIENPATGIHREIKAGRDGSYRAAQLPTGTYTITRRSADGQTSVRENVGVSVGTGTPVNFQDVGATRLDTVTVTSTGINPIDVSSVESTTVLTAEQIAKIPVARNITNVALLAPGTVRGDAAFGNLASFGGSSVAENAYFVNGFNITNAFKNINFAQIPFEAIAEQQIKTGGYGAEFGRSLGGVINIVTKRGTNDFHAGGNVFYTPESLTSNRRDVFFNDGRLISDNSRDEGWTATYGTWASGALVQDKLFFYGLFQFERRKSNSFPGTFDGVVGNSNIANNSRAPTWLAKLDWNISDNHLLEFTAFSDTTKNDVAYFRTNFGTVDNPSSRPERGDFQGVDSNEVGGENYVGRYTGYLTDNLTVSALYGHGESKRKNFGVSASGLEQRYSGIVGGPVEGCPVIADIRTSVRNGSTPAIIGCSFVPFLGRPDAQDQRDQYRVDIEWTLGDHLLRFGYDRDDFQSVDGETFSGGAQWRYQTSSAFGDIVRQRVFQTGANVKVEQEALYLEDSWSITPTFVAKLGVRLDDFKNKNGAGETFVSVKDQFQPRVGFSWDVMGDSSLKVFGNYGRYALPLTATVAVRGASASLFSQQFFQFTGVDPVTGAPTGLTPVTDVQFLNNEFGVAKDARTIASQNLDPQYQDEFILGVQKQMTDNFSVGFRSVYRDLKRAIDDTCDSRPIEQFAIDNGLDFNPFNEAFAFCHLFNPGRDLQVFTDVDGDGTLEFIEVPGEVISPKAKRRYLAGELFFEGNWDRLFLQGSYTWSHNWGNTEGGVKSDIGQDDTGTTQDFDYPELVVGSEGNLPNDRRHSFKLFGAYRVTDELSVGSNLLVQSGRPENCIGVFADDPIGYGASYFSCAPRGVDDPDGLDTTIVPRGSVGRTPWTWQLDLNVQYQPAYVEGLTFKVDVFNVFNKRQVTQVDEFGEDSANNPLFDTSYLTPTAFQNPRSVRFLLQYDF